MRALVALVAHEINQRKALLAAAAVASLLPVLAPLLPSTGSNPAEDIREAVLWVIVGGLVPLFALLLGVGFIGRDLSEGRLGFYYSQPLSAPTLWFGKLGAIVLLLWMVEAIIMLPTVLLSSDPVRFLVLPNVLDPFVPKWLSPALCLVASTVIVLVAHAVGVAWRARSAWLVVDTVALLVVALVAWLAVSPFAWLVAPDIVVGAAVWLFAWVLVALTAAGAAQVAFGRVDAKRCHRVLSSMLWCTLVLGSGVLLGWSLWVRSAGLDDLDRVSVLATGPGNWIAVSGGSAGRFDYHPRFLVNVADGRSLPIGPRFDWHGLEVVFSDDGSTAVWLEAHGFPSWQVMSADLTVELPSPVASGVTLGSEWEDFAVAPDGGRIATLEGGMLAVYERQAGDQLAAVRIPAALSSHAIEFDDSETVRVLASSRENRTHGDRRVWLLWFDLADRELTEKVEIATWWRWRGASRDGRPDHPLALVELGDERSVAVRDPETGEVLRDLEIRGLSDVRLLDDGRLLVIRDRKKGDCAELIAADGQEIWSVDLPEAGAIFDAAFIAPSRLLLGLIDREGSAEHRVGVYRTLVLDVEAGTQHELSPELVPVLGRWGIWSAKGSWAVGSVAGRLLRDRNGSVYLLESGSEEYRRILPVSG